MTDISLATADGVVTVQAPADGPWPIWPTDTLLARVLALPDSSVLAEVWVNRGWPSLQSTPLLDQATFHAIEREVAYWEQDCSSIESGQLRGWLRRLKDDVPAHVREPALEQICVLAGTTADDMELMGHGKVTTVGRLPVIRDIVERSLGLAGSESPADRQAEVDAAEEAEARAGGYPGSKATIPEVKTWVGEDPNHMARAYAQELDRPTPRVRLVKWLEDALGEKRLAQVKDAMGAAVAPPLSFQSSGEAAEDTPPTPDAGIPDASGAGVGEEPGDGGPAQAASTPPVEDEAETGGSPPTPSETNADESPVAEALRLAGEALIAAAKALEDAA